MRFKKNVLTFCLHKVFIECRFYQARHTGKPGSGTLVGPYRDPTKNWKTGTLAEPYKKPKNRDLRPMTLVGTYWDLKTWKAGLNVTLEKCYNLSLLLSVSSRKMLQNLENKTSNFNFI